MSPKWRAIQHYDGKTWFFQESHPIHIHVFKYNHRWTLCVWLGFRHNATGRFVESIPSNIGDPEVQFGNLLAGLLAVRAAIILTREFAMQPPELLVCFLHGLGVFVTGSFRLAVESLG